ncbi:proline iminopeptidase [Methylobacterium sp. 174MFSha1.1]|nr:proline iminopeptidase [Methylobacterium sp. 174MFSha1.1]
MSESGDLIACDLLTVADGNRIYWESYVHPDGRPALYLNGGPGSGLGTGSYRRIPGPGDAGPRLW